MAAFDCSKDTTAKGFVITVSKEEGDRRAKKEYEEFTHHLNHDWHGTSMPRSPAGSKFKVAHYSEVPWAYFW
jgi:hypothetical protein